MRTEQARCRNMEIKQRELEEVCVCVCVCVCAHVCVLVCVSACVPLYLYSTQSKPKAKSALAAKWEASVKGR